MQQIVVFDTNILISAVLSALGNPARCLDLAKAEKIESVTCGQILAEFEEKLRNKFKHTSERITAAVEQVRIF